MPEIIVLIPVPDWGDWVGNQTVSPVVNFVSFQGRLEWESDSGRQITIGDVSVNELSKVEIQAMQRLAINQLQTMEIPVSHGLLRGGYTTHMQHV